MYALEPLVEGAVPLDPLQGCTAKKLNAEVAKILRKRKWKYAPPVTGVAAVRLPSDSASLQRLLAEARPAGWSREDALSAAAVLLSQPAYICPLTDGSAEMPGRKVRRLGLVTALSAEEEIWIGIGKLQVEQEIGPNPWTRNARITADWYFDVDDACDELERIYLDAPSHSGLPRLPRAWWIGGGAGTEVPLSAEEKKRIAAVGRVAGYDVEVIEALGRPELLARISNEKPQALIEWCAYAIGKPQEIVWRYKRDVADGVHIPMWGAETLDDALATLRRDLRGRFVHAVHPSPYSAEDRPRSVEEAVCVAARACSNLIILDDALDSARASQYGRPWVVSAYLDALNNVVQAWRDGRLADGNFEGALKGQGVLGYRSDISDTARKKYPKDYRRIYNDRPIFLGPHLRKGVGPPRRILGIYWYVDTQEKTFVIGHVGRKLRDRSNKG